MATGKRIRTLHILDGLERRGAETFAVQLVDRLSREVFFPAIWSIKPIESESYLVPHHTPVFTRTVDGIGRPVVYGTVRVLLDVLHTYRPDLIHCHGGRALKYAVAAKPFWRARGYVYTKIGSVHPWLDHPIKRRFYGMLLEQVDAVVAVGDEIRREVVQVFHPRRPRVLTIHTGREPATFAGVTPEVIARKRAELGLGPLDLCLQTVGAISWEKDPQLLLRIFVELVREHPRLRLAFVGGGPLEAEVRQQAVRAGVQDYVRFLGIRTDVPELLCAADIFVLPSVTEGLPGVLIEAGMAGLPAVAFRVGSVADILKDGVTGFVVPPKNAEMFKQRLRQLICDADLRRSMGQEALRLCRRDFDIAQSVRGYEALFCGLLDASMGPSRAAVRQSG